MNYKMIVQWVRSASTSGSNFGPKYCSVAWVGPTVGPWSGAMSSSMNGSGAVSRSTSGFGYWQYRSKSHYWSLMEMKIK